LFLQAKHLSFKQSSLTLTRVGANLKSLKVLGGKLEIPSHLSGDNNLKEILFSNANINESSIGRLISKHCAQVTKLTLHESLPYTTFQELVTLLPDPHSGQSL
jgi:hypothetical protein